MGCGAAKATTVSQLESDQPTTQNNGASGEDGEPSNAEQQEVPKPVAFEIPLDESESIIKKHPPKRFQKLEEQAQSTALTAKDIEEKQQKAEERRQELASSPPLVQLPGEILQERVLNAQKAAEKMTGGRTKTGSTEGSETGEFDAPVHRSRTTNHSNMFPWSDHKHYMLATHKPPYRMIRRSRLTVVIEETDATDSAKPEGGKEGAVENGETEPPPPPS